MKREYARRTNGALSYLANSEKWRMHSICTQFAWFHNYQLANLIDGGGLL